MRSPQARGPRRLQACPVHSQHAASKIHKPVRTPLLPDVDLLGDQTLRCSGLFFASVPCRPTRVPCLAGIPRPSFQLLPHRPPCGPVRPCQPGDGRFERVSMEGQSGLAALIGLDLVQQPFAASLWAISARLRVLRKDGTGSVRRPSERSLRRCPSRQGKASCPIVRAYHENGQAEQEVAVPADRLGLALGLHRRACVCRTVVHRKRPGWDGACRQPAVRPGCPGPHPPAYASWPFESHLRPGRHASRDFPTAQARADFVRVTACLVGCHRVP